MADALDAHKDPAELVACLAVACGVRAIEAQQEALLSSYENRLREVE